MHVRIHFRTFYQELGMSVYENVLLNGSQSTPYSDLLRHFWLASCISWELVQFLEKRNESEGELLVILFIC